MTRKATKKQVKVFLPEQIPWLWKAKQVDILFNNAQDSRNKALALLHEVKRDYVAAYKKHYGEKWFEKYYMQDRIPRKIQREFGPALKVLKTYASF